MEGYVVLVVAETAALVLEKDGKMVDSEFINKYAFENELSEDELKEEVRKLAKRNNLTDSDYSIHYDRKTKNIYVHR